MQRFFNTVSIVASLLCLQSAAYAQEAADLMTELPEPKNEISVPSVETYSLETLPALERVISEEDILPSIAEQLEGWTLYFLPHLSPDSTCPRSEDSITLFCIY